jgi:hypothetical protein
MNKKIINKINYSSLQNVDNFNETQVHLISYKRDGINCQMFKQRILEVSKKT